MKIAEIRIEIHMDKGVVADMPQAVLDVILPLVEGWADGAKIRSAMYGLQEQVASNLDHYEMYYEDDLKFEVKHKEYL